ncbi:response regulator [Cohnella suwonensis]|uniref:Response regulator n=1 Tax=Cohnella suwonensis TaxID=696072 RepID=A0ABW0LTP4_9BACL
MYNVLVVDDEPRHRRGLTRMIQELRPHYSIYDAKNGMEALERIYSNLIDIVITDIQMPVVDGLQLMEQLRGSRKDIKVIILSAYGQFEYAQKAIALGVSDYILKPVDETKIEQLLAGTESKLKDEREDRLEFQMNKWIRGHLSEQEASSLERQFPMDGDGIVFVAELGMPESSGMERNRLATQWETFRDEVKNDLKAILRPIGEHAVFYLPEAADRLVAVIATQGNGETLLHDVADKVNEWIRRMSGMHNIQIAVGVGDVCPNLGSEAKISFHQAKAILKYNFFAGSGSVLAYKDIRATTPPQSFNRYLGDIFATAAMQTNREQIVRIVGENIASMLTAGYPEPGLMISSCAIALQQQAVKSCTSIQNVAEDLMQCKHIDQLIAVVAEKLHAMAMQQADKKNRRSDDIIDMCKAYIDRHYAEPISLTSIADHFHFNASYFSNLFKNGTQMNISDYILKTRMSVAERLLQKSSHKVYVIASKVGYPDVKYFIRLFKKEFGLSPDEYRRQMGNSQREEAGL